MIEQTSRSSLDDAIDAKLRTINTAIPARVVDYDDKGPTITAQVDFVDYYRSDGPERIAVDWPPIPDVPVLFVNCSGDWSDTQPLKKDDGVLLIFSQRSLNDWYAGDGKTQTSPSLLHTHGPADAIAIAGLLASGTEKPEASKTDRIIRHKNGKVRLALKSSGSVDLTTDRLNVGSPNASTASAKGNLTNDRLNTLATDVTTLKAIFGLPPVIFIGSVESTKLFTND